MEHNESDKTTKSINQALYALRKMLSMQTVNNSMMINMAKTFHL